MTTPFFFRSPGHGAGPSHAARPPSGATLLELATVLLLLSMALSMAAPAAAGLRDRWAVRSAREALVSVLARARAEAPRWGGSRVTFDVPSSVVRLEAADSQLATLALDSLWTVRLDPGRDIAPVAYGPLGLGQVASRTIRLVRGEATATLRISSYGRVAR